MHCDRCHKPVSDDAPIWRISIGYSGPPQSAVQSWCNACANRRIELFNRLPPDAENWSEDRRQRLLKAYADHWHPARPCQHCGRPVIFHAVRRIPLHAVCGPVCRLAVYAAQARWRRRKRDRACRTCAKLFQPKRTDAVFCAPPCRRRAYQQRLALTPPAARSAAPAGC
jgi:hypothetical protein